MGAAVVILPDKDEPGRKHAIQIAQSLTGKAKSVKLIELPGQGKDFTDWLVASGTKEQLLQIVAIPYYMIACLNPPGSRR